MQAAPVAPVAPDLPAAQSLAPEAAPQRRARVRSVAAEAARSRGVREGACGVNRGVK